MQARLVGSHENRQYYYKGGHQWRSNIVTLAFPSNVTALLPQLLLRSAHLSEGF